MRLKMAKRLALAMEVAVYLQDEALLNESAMRLYNAVAPLLTGNTRSRRLTKVLATAHAALAHLTRLRDQRTISATASITYELVGLYRLVNEAPAAAHFSKLDLPLLLKPESPSVRHTHKCGFRLQGSRCLCPRPDPSVTLRPSSPPQSRAFTDCALC
jgi:hypothetical protein